MKQNNEILNHIMDIKQNTASINEHLKTLNSKVATNVKNIESNRDRTEKINVKLAKWGGVFTVLFIIIQLGLKYLI